MSKRILKSEQLATYMHNLCLYQINDVNKFDNGNNYHSTCAHSFSQTSNHNN